jgi:hypothetical protein
LFYFCACSVVSFCLWFYLCACTVVSFCLWFYFCACTVVSFCLWFYFCACTVVSFCLWFYFCACTVVSFCLLFYFCACTVVLFVFLFLFVLLFLFILCACTVTALYSKIFADLGTLRTYNTIRNICIPPFQPFTLESLRTWEVDGHIIRNETSVTDNHVYVSFVVFTIPSFFPLSWLITGVTRVTPQAPLVKQELPTFPEYLILSCA